jgi:TonB-dependent starch-binding outer membrane protein SusC
MHFMASLGPPFRELATKTLRVMKLTALIVLIACLQVSARGYGQPVTLKVHLAPLEAVLAEIQKQTGYNFVYAKIELENAHPVDLDVHNADLRQVLVQCFRGQPLAYTIEDQYVVVKKRPVEPSVQKSVGDSSKPREIAVTGKVTDEHGEPLAGASVSVKNGKQGTLTNEKGIFVLKKVASDAVLEISFTGYKLTEIHVAGEKGVLAVQLPLASSSLDASEVIAYGTTTERLGTGDVTTVNSVDIEKQPVDNPILALEGRVPGLFIAQTTGFSGAGISIELRGQNSIAWGNDPLYVVDGVPFSSQLLPNLGSVLGTPTLNMANSGSPFSYLNPSDIESISILKDADATAIYGSRAASGAILITTKRGKPGETKVDFNLQNGWGEVTRKLDLLNLQQYLEMRHEAISNDGLTTQSTDYDINGTWDSTRFTDWQKTLIGGSAQYMNFTGDVSGGNATTQYLVSGTFHRETTVFPGNFSDEKGALHFSLNSASTNQKFHMQFSGNYLLDNNQLPQSDLTRAAITLAPDAPPLYNKDGSINWALSSGSATWQNPLASNYNTYQNKGYNLIGNAIVTYNVLPHLEIKSSFGYTNLQTNELVLFPLLSISPEFQPYATRSAQYGNNNIQTWNIEPQLLYKQSFKIGKFEGLVGETILQTNSNGQQITGKGYVNDAVMPNITSATSISAQSTVMTTYKYNAVFGRLSYNLNDKYLINLSGRRDGSSRFGPATQFHDFESVGAGWIFSKEPFIRDLFSALSFGKLRISYGTTGNDQIADYQYLNLYYPVVPQVPYQGSTGIAPVTLTNPYLEWEETKKLEYGAEVGFFKDRILFNINYYLNRTSNQLLAYQLPYITGFTDIVANFPATVQNTGDEFKLSTINVKTADFSWTTNINLTIPRNKLVAFPNLATSSYAGIFIIGQPTYITHTYHFLGVNPTTGVYQFSDGHGGVTPTPDTAANPLTTTETKLINTAPKFYGGFENSFQYKGFGLDILFQFVKQLGANYLFGNFMPGLFAGGQGNQPTTILNRWQKPGDIKNIQRFTTTYNWSEEWNDAVLFSDAAYSDASYIRLKNLALSWQVPRGWKTKAHLQSARLYIQGQNLLTFTHYIGLDPETRSSTTLPPLRVLTVGLQVTL